MTKVVNRSDLNMRDGVAMLELIFAIVVMGIVMLAAPMLMSQATQGSLNTVKQEAINAAAAQISLVQSVQWDESDTNPSTGAPILKVTSGYPNFDEVTSAISGTTVNVGRRAGTPQTSKRSFVFSKLNPSLRLGASAIGPDGGDNDDVDDFTGTKTLVNIAATSATKGDYVQQLQVATAVSYVSDVPSSFGVSTVYAPSSSGATTNVKEISVRVYAVNNTDTNVTLRAFVSNIGSFDFDERILP